MLRELEQRRRVNEHEMLVLDKLEIHIKNEAQKELELTETLRAYLTEEECRAVMLRYFYDVPYSELARYFQTSEAAVRQRISRVIKKLRREAPDLWYE